MLELDEILFHWLWKTKRKVSKQVDSEFSVTLDQDKSKLMMLATALVGETVLIKEAENNGGFIGNSLFLPRKIDIFKDKSLNYKSYLYRIAIDSSAKLAHFHFKSNILSTSDLNFLSLISYPTLLKITRNNFCNVDEILLELSNGFFKEIKNDKKNNSAFFIHWQKVLLDPTYLERCSSLNDFEIKLLKNIVNLDNLDPEQLIAKGKKIKAELKSFGICIPEKLKLSYFFPTLPVSSQVIKIKTQKDSKLASKELNKAETYKKSKSKERVKKVTLEEDDPDCNPMNLLMEAVKTADIFKGGKKMVDGSDELDDHYDAINELELREITRSSTQTKSVFKADISIETNIELEEETLQKDSLKFFYDEWSFKKKLYKKDWCCVNEDRLEKLKDTIDFEKYYDSVIKKHKKEIKNLRHQLQSLLLSRKAMNRQTDGPEIDIDALIDAKADLYSGHTPSERLYISKRKTSSDLATLILLDSSLSTDSWINGERVMDIAKESIIVLEEVLSGLFENLMISSFYSNTRKDCRYSIIKDFSEKWGSVSSRLDSAEPNGYTRIGPALRHSFTKLDKIKAKKKVILLLSDGKPTDYDLYEGKHGIADVRQCVREAKSKDIEIFSLAIDQEAKFYFPQLFGASNYQVLPNPDQLTTQMIKLFSKLLN